MKKVAVLGGSAEASAVNGERITPTTAIIDVGPSLMVNSAYHAPPNQVTATLARGA